MIFYETADILHCITVHVIPVKYSQS